MDRQPLLIILLVLAAGAIAFLLGERRAMRRAMEAERKERPLPKPASREEPRERSVSSTAPISEVPKRPSENAPSSGGAKALTVVPPGAAALQPSPSPKLENLAMLDFEEDDAVEPTRVGPAASAPPSPRVVLQPPVKKVVFDEGATSDEPPHASPLFLVSATAQTDKGLRRKRNEDCLGVLESRNLFIVADGMGGYAGGEQASKLSVETITQAFRNNAFEGAPHEDLPREASELARAIQTANAVIGEEAQKHHALVGMGTTVCAAVFSPNKRRLFIGHVGDSRCYRLRDGIFRQITADHTMAELGVKGPESQQLSRAVGIWPTVTIDIVMAVPQTGDVYLLCSDGLTKMLSDEIIGNVLRNEEDPKVAVERLIFFANSRGGKDNITVVLVRVVPTDWKPRPSEPFRRASNRPPSSEDPPVSVGPMAGASAGMRVAPPAKKRD